MSGKVLTVASGKGGVGKTTTAVNLAVALWREGNAVALVDADLGMANLAAVLALEPEATLHDVLSGEAAPDEAIIEAKGGDLLVLPGERELAGFANADPGKLRDVLSDLADRCDYVLVDTGAGLSHEDVLPLGLADEILLVTTPDPAAIGDTRKTLELAGLLDGPVRGVVVTRALEDTDAEAIAEEIGVELLVTIPEDAAVTESVSRGDPLESHAPEAPATLAYRTLAKSIVGDHGAAVTGEATEDDALAGDDEPAEDQVAGAADDVDESDDAGADESDADAVETADANPPGEADTAEDEPAETDATADPDDTDELDATDTDGAGTAETDESDADEAESDEPDADDSGTDGADDADVEPEESGEAKRGGVLGWFGRLFS